MYGTSGTVGTRTVGTGTKPSLAIIFLGILLYGGVEAQLADEVGGVHKFALGVLHHGEESLQAGHLAPGLVQLRVLVAHLTFR